MVRRNVWGGRVSLITECWLLNRCTRLQGMIKTYPLSQEFVEQNICGPVLGPEPHFTFRTLPRALVPGLTGPGARFSWTMVSVTTAGTSTSIPSSREQSIEPSGFIYKEVQHLQTCPDWIRDIQWVLLPVEPLSNSNLYGVC